MEKEKTFFMADYVKFTGLGNSSINGIQNQQQEVVQNVD